MGKWARRKAERREDMTGMRGVKRLPVLGERVARYPEAERKSCCISIIKRAVVLGERVESWGQV